MNLEERQVLHSRWRVFSQWQDKEWWYSGVLDPASGAWVSWHVVRVHLIDELAFSVFDPRDRQPFHFRKRLWLDSEQKKNELCLKYARPGLTLAYEGAAERGWTLNVKRGDLAVALNIEPSLPPFTKFNNDFVYRYGLLHFFHNRASGQVRIGSRSYEIDRGLGYYDHCFGRVPSQSGWHWVALQNEEIALSSLINYGAFSQRYTQIFFRQNPGSYRLGEWIRLEQDVSFELEPGCGLDSPWRVTSPDMELEVTPLQSVTSVERIPPLLPVLVDVAHSELFVTARGRIRVDGRWFETGELKGVMEQHVGRW